MIKLTGAMDILGPVWVNPNNIDSINRDRERGEGFTSINTFSGFVAVAESEEEVVKKILEWQVGKQALDYGESDGLDVLKKLAGIQGPLSLEE